MIDLNSFVSDFEDGLPRYGMTNSDRYAAALQLLCSTARKYNQACEELDRLKAFVGFNKPFPFLRLPRELRDQIYTYCLCPATPVEPTRKTPLIPATDNPFKPPTPGLLRVNRQMYHEAGEVLYSRNMFRFDGPPSLRAFEGKIALESREQVKQICIHINFRGQALGPVDESDDDLFFWAKQLHFPPEWIAALKACRLKKIEHLRVRAKMYGPRSLSPLSMPEDLKDAIIQFLERVPDEKVPKLSLKGFQEKEIEKFPKRWTFVTDQWDAYKKETENRDMTVSFEDTIWTFEEDSSEEDGGVDEEL
ncbi:hypothetical protein P154DRAFT_527389 [Amniculicola lignicola CBS 123094]|uniref:Uncharacterized protein n=1 Tax=Amniculicola lignicola CBS 123094 TaxID=1392246 RepID=A0A6A5VZ73_9PLEO|nr:hypothetical protein P154DRAFT_527389 [Amniculicola lignicola CBS 123094]